MQAETTTRMLAEADALRARDLAVLWLDAHSHPRQAERMSGLNTLVENTPQDSAYQRMAKNYLADEQHYAGFHRQRKRNDQ